MTSKEQRSEIVERFVAGRGVCNEVARVIDEHDTHAESEVTGAVIASVRCKVEAILRDELRRLRRIVREAGLDDNES